MFLSERKIKNQVTRFIAGDCSADEARVISGLIATDKEYKRISDAYNSIWSHTESESTGDSFDIDAAWAKVDARISKQPLKLIHKNEKAGVPVRKIASYALRAAAVLLLGLAVFQLAIPRNHQKTFASGSCIAAPIRLADGSTVFLNSASTIKFPEKFGNKGREVYFWGEAFFEITPDPSRPFVIETGETRIKVLGTSFNVKAYTETNDIEVVVNSGKVLFYHVDKNDHLLGQVTLLKGDKGVFFRNTGLIARMINDEPNYLSWKTGVLVFSETSLDKVLYAVGQKYGVIFNLEDKQLASLKLTATFDNETLDAVLEVLKLVHNLQFVNNGSDYLVKKSAG